MGPKCVAHVVTLMGENSSSSVRSKPCSLMYVSHLPGGEALNVGARFVGMASR